MHLFTNVVNCCFQFSLLEQKSKNQNVDIALDNTGKVSYFSIFMHWFLSSGKLREHASHSMVKSCLKISFAAYMPNPV